MTSKKHSPKFELLGMDGDRKQWRMTCKAPGCEFLFLSENSLNAEKIAKDVCDERFEAFHVEA